MSLRYSRKPFDSIFGHAVCTPVGGTSFGKLEKATKCDEMRV